MYSIFLTVEFFASFSVSGCQNGSVHVWTVPQVSSDVKTPLRPLQQRETTDPWATETQEHERLDYFGKAKEHLVMRGHHQAVTHLAFSPTGLFVASGCSQGLVNVWGLHVSMLCIWIINYRIWTL